MSLFILICGLTNWNVYELRKNFILNFQHINNGRDGYQGTFGGYSVPATINQRALKCYLVVALLNHHVPGGYLAVWPLTTMHLELKLFFPILIPRFFIQLKLIFKLLFICVYYLKILVYNGSFLSYSCFQTPDTLQKSHPSPKIVLPHSSN